MISTLFIDLDDTLYSANNGLWREIKHRMNIYMETRLGIAPEVIPTLRETYFQQYGTTLRGLQAHYHVDELEYLAFVHDLPLRDYIAPDPNLRTALEACPARKFIFTNADSGHAERVLAVLGVRDCFEGIIDVVAISPYCKPMPESFDIALKLAGNPAPRACAMIDDLPRTTKAAREAGLHAVLFGKNEAHPDADAVMNDWAQLNEIMARKFPR